MTSRTPFRSPSHAPLLTREAERALFATYHAGDPATCPESRRAADEIARANMGLVVSIARKYINLRLDWDRLVSAGSFGLARAITKFEPERHLKFSTYATYWIRQAIQYDLMEDRTIHVPVHVHKEIARVAKGAGDGGRREYVAAARAAQKFQDAWSLDDAGRPRCLFDLIAAPAGPDAGDLEDRRLRVEAASARLAPVLARWTEAERRAVHLRLGGMDFKAVGAELGVTGTRAHQLCGRAIERARRAEAVAGRAAGREACGKAALAGRSRGRAG